MARFTRKDLITRGDKTFLVSTVRLPFDTGYDSPFETMVFAYDPSTEKVDYTDLFCDRYESQDEAAAGHERVLARWNPGTRSID